MSRALDARRLGGGLLVWSLLPFPFVYVIFAPFWIVAGAAGLWRVVWPNARWRPSKLIQNVLGVVTIGVVLAAGGLHVGPLRPLGHLLLLLTALRVATIDDVPDLRRALPAVFLVGIVGIVSAVHVAVAPYLLISVMVWWYAGMWLFLLQVGEQAETYLGRPRWAHAVKAGGAAAVLAIPVFLVMPRLGSPILGGAFGGESGFPDAVELARGGAISESDRPAMVLDREDGEPIPASWLRLRATVYEMSSAAVWTPRRSELRQPELDAGRVWLTDDRPSLNDTVAIDVSTIDHVAYLLTAPGTVALEVGEPVQLDSTGGVALERRGGSGARYRLWVESDSIGVFDEPQARDTHLPVHDERVHDLANEVSAGASSPLEIATRVESHLESGYQYSLDGGFRGVRDPVAWFLFDRQSGHCEFFAAAMVVMMRHQGIPARMLVGYHGGAAQPGEATVVVRQGNAHAWVEVWLGDDRGWVVFDPTPAEGIDGLDALSRFGRLKMAWQSLEDFFDRRILTFGLNEQVGIVAAVSEAWKVAMSWAVASLRWWALAPALGVIMWLVFGGGGRAHRGLPASRAISQLGGQLARQGVDVSESATMRWIGARAAEHWPQVSQSLKRLVELAEKEQYAPVGAVTGQRRAVLDLWATIRREVR